MTDHDHDHGIKCTGCTVDAGECCRHCPAAIAAEETAAQPNVRVRAAAMEILDLADRAGVPITFAMYGSAGDPDVPRMIHVQGRSGEKHMLLSDALRIALRGRGVERRHPTPLCPHTGIEFDLPVSHARVTVICEPTFEQFTEQFTSDAVSS